MFRRLRPNKRLKVAARVGAPRWAARDMKRRLLLLMPLIVALALAGCHRPTEIRGLYLSYEGTGTLFPCDNSHITMDVPDSALAARHRSIAAGNEPLFVRLKGVKGHAGSPKGSPRYYFLVQQVLEIRGRAAGECPGVAEPIAPLVPKS